jgi:chlorobactene glucosyltransferase
MNQVIFDYLTDGALNGFIVFQSILVLVILSNWLVLRRATRAPKSAGMRKVSILVPARNEENSIRTCLESLLGQDYPDFEVIVLDDESTDGTSRVIREVKSDHPDLSVLAGKTLPPGWGGKNWACHQLADAASGEILLFTDADTVHASASVENIIRVMDFQKADLLTGVPRQEMETWSERLLVPLFPWAFYTFNPLLVAYAVRFKELSAAVGQLMVFRREAYRQIGGHAAVRESMVEDLELARGIKENGLRWRVMDITNLISCRMYRNSSQVFHGLAKNLFPAFEYRILVYLFVWLWLAFLFLEPVVVILAGIFGGALPEMAILKAITSICLAWFIWVFVFFRLKLTAWMGFFYPVLIVGFEAMAAASFWLTVTGRTSWKGRTVKPPRLRL